ncbi:membrane-associated guanylate kinase, WW and PDZ domain-containing protein 3-like isoform X2 [Antedon mediterranea]|uniref:membrane-associated guanylate kinase, WW and PDZ domain-containing protein 3-like isoform X2 n=1 Tax=Antedon mediterranea TaxID=105859 RepID=UPI003AF7CCAE
MTKDQTKKGSKPPKHWSQNVHDSAISSSANGNPLFHIKGGAENGQFIYLGDIKHEKLLIRSGKLHSDEILLQVNGSKVCGCTLWDVEPMLKQLTDKPFYLKTVKPGPTLSKDLRRYLNTRFHKGSVDHELQQTIRDNLYMRTVPCTTRAPRDEEVDGVDYKFLSTEQFIVLEKTGHLLESGIFDGNHYGTPKPPATPDASVPSTPQKQPNPTENNPDHRPGARPSSQGKRQRNKSSIEATTLNSKMVDEAEQKKQEDVDKRTTELGLLPPDWEVAFTDQGDMYFINHVTESTQWLDPRLEMKRKKDLLECQDDELPYGWEKIDDPQFGCYYIDHVNRRTQYENPVVQAKKEQGKSSTLPRTNKKGKTPPPPPPRTVSEGNISSKATSAKQANGPVETESAFTPTMSPTASEWRAMFTSNPNELKGTRIKTTLLKSNRGFGFTIIGGDDPEEFLQIKSVVEGGPAYDDGVLQMGDVLVYVNDTLVLGFTHHDVVKMFQAVHPGEPVDLDVCRGYPLPFDPEDPYTHVVPNSKKPQNEKSRQEFDNVSHTSISSQDHPDDSRYSKYNDVHKSLPDLSQKHAPEELNKRAKTPTPGKQGYIDPQVSPEHRASLEKRDFIDIGVTKGNMGFGFTIADSPYGQKVKQILDSERCKTLREGDILMEINDEYIRDRPHTYVVNLLKNCPNGVEAALVVQRGGMLKPVKNMNMLGKLPTNASPLDMKKQDRNQNSLTNDNRSPIVGQRNDGKYRNEYNRQNGPMTGNQEDDRKTSERDLNDRHPEDDRISTGSGKRDFENERSDKERRESERSQYDERGRMNDYRRPDEHEDRIIRERQELERTGPPPRDRYDPEGRMGNGRYDDPRGAPPYNDAYPRKTPPLEYDARYNGRPKTPSGDGYISRPPYQDERSRTPKPDRIPSPSKSPYSKGETMDRRPPSRPEVDDRRPPSRPEVDDRRPPSRPEMDDRRPASRPEMDDRRPPSRPEMDDRRPPSRPEMDDRRPPSRPEMDDRRPPSRPRMEQDPMGDEANYMETTVFLKRKEQGFGFRIVGGHEEGSQVSIGAIVAGSAAHLDGRLLTGDELLYVDGQSVIGSSHRKVVNLMGNAALAGRVSLGIRRKLPANAAPLDDRSPMTKRPPSTTSQGSDPHVTYPYDINLSRRDTEGFGFVILSSTLQSGSKIGRIIEGSPADRCGQLSVGDRLIAVNNIDITTMHHKDIVNMVKDTGRTCTLTIGSPEIASGGSSPRGSDSMVNALAMPADIKGSDASLRPSSGQKSPEKMYHDEKLRGQDPRQRQPSRSSDIGPSSPSKGPIRRDPSYPGNPAYRREDPRLAHGPPPQVNGIDYRDSYSKPDHGRYPPPGGPSYGPGYREGPPYRDGPSPSYRDGPPPHRDVPPYRDGPSPSYRGDGPPYYRDGHPPFRDGASPYWDGPTYREGQPQHRDGPQGRPNSRPAPDRYAPMDKRGKHPPSPDRGPGRKTHPYDNRREDFNHPSNDRFSDQYPYPERKTYSPSNPERWQDGYHTSPHPRRHPPPHVVDDRRQKNSPMADRKGYPSPKSRSREASLSSLVSSPQNEVDTGGYFNVVLEKGTTGFGFSIRGGREYQNTPIFILRMAPEGPAGKDGRIKVGDHLLEINGQSTENMLHTEAIDAIKRGGTRLHLILRRDEVSPTLVLGTENNHLKRALSPSMRNRRSYINGY